MLPVFRRERITLLKQKPSIANQGTSYLTFDEVRARLETREVVFHELDYETPVTQEEFDILVSIYDETHVMSGEVCKRVLEDYHKEKLAYEKMSASCDQKLQAILDEHDALFEIDIVSFSPEKFFGYITFREQLDINTYYPTTLETIYDDTKSALKKLKESADS